MLYGQIDRFPKTRDVGRCRQRLGMTDLGRGAVPTLEGSGCRLKHEGEERTPRVRSQGSWLSYLELLLQGSAGW